MADALYEKRADKLQKLQAKAMNAGTPEEAKVYSDKIEELLILWNYEDDILSYRTGHRGELVRMDFLISTPHPALKLALLRHIGKAFGVRIIQYVGSEKTNEYGFMEVVILGYDRDIDQTKMLYQLILPQVNNFLKKFKTSKIKQHNWFMGYNHRIKDRLDEAYRKAVAESNENAETGALVKADKDVAVNLFVAGEFTDLYSVTPPQLRGKHQGVYEGLADADKTDIGQRRMQSRKAIGS